MEKLTRGPLLNRVIQDQIKQYITDNRLASGRSAAAGGPVGD